MRFLTCYILVVFLAGCAATTVPAQVGISFGVGERRTAGAIAEDLAIRLRFNNELKEQSFFDRHSDSVQITSFNRIVLLTGSVKTADSFDFKRKEIVDLARRLKNVRSVINELGVGPNRSRMEEDRDSQLVSAVLEAVDNVSGLGSSSIKAEAYRGSIYLMGLVTEKEARLITDAVSRVSGVARVIRVFEVISERELSTITGKKEQPEVSRLTTPQATEDQVRFDCNRLTNDAARIQCFSERGGANGAAEGRVSTSNKLSNGSLPQSQPLIQSTERQQDDPLSASRKKCAELGFKPGTEKFGECVLKLSK